MIRVKLIRDKLDGRGLKGESTRLAQSKAELFMAIALKVYEELGEVIDAPDDAEEYADLLEAVFAMGHIQGVDIDDVLLRMERKRDERGGFMVGKMLIQTVSKKVVGGVVGHG